MRFNDEKHEKFFNRIKAEAMSKHGFTEEEMTNCDLRYLNKQTNSRRILHFIKLAYYLGMMRGIKDCDEVFYTKISLITPFIKAKSEDSSNNVEKFHKERFMFAILKDGKLVYSINDKRGHKEWLNEEHNIASNDFETLTRGYAKDGDIVFYKGSDFTYDTNVINEAYRYGATIAKMRSCETVNVYVGVLIGEVGEIWKTDKLLYSINIENHL